MIHQLSSCDQWYYIASEQNPAVVLSRVLLPGELRDDSLWLHGPELLQSTYSTSVIAEPTQRDDFDCELMVPERTLETSLLNQNLVAYFTEEGIEWNFIPPRAPLMGGLLEAGIKSVKYHLKRALGRSRLTYEEFETVIIQDCHGWLGCSPTGRPIFDDLFQHLGRISATTRRMLFSKWSSVCGLSA
ncbi:uncharacterized protein TNCV_2861391 [Trichonephila clavipes]|nr:uncharacterized protein TNCV_2861391 [Trichonephila clavipes]